MPTPGIPADAPHDAVMATEAEVQHVREWADAAFTGEEPAGRIRVTVRRQDHSVLQFGRSCIDTPIRIGRRTFAHGLGTHANSEIEVAVPVGARAFQAWVGVDGNADTGGTRGSVVFSVELAGREVARTATLKGGQDAVRVDVPMAAGVPTVTLKVSDAGDGTAFDQADWADAEFVMADGEARRLDDAQSDLLPAEAGPPFSFTYGGARSQDLLRAWPRTVTTRELPDAAEHTVTWTDPVSGIIVRAAAKVFQRYPAVEWVLRFENAGAQDTPILEQVQALDVGLRSGYAKAPLVLHRLEGDSCAERSFQPFDTRVEPGKPVRTAPTGGRPSSISAFPWFNVEYAGRGVITAVGWTGQWSAGLERSGSGPARLVAGMEQTHLRLHPGESIRTPRILMLAWQGDRQRAHLQFRRLMLFHYAPRPDGKPAQLPIALQTFDRYSKRPGWATEDGQLAYAATAHKLGCDTLWLDAAWFPGGFPGGVGTWRADAGQFPRGLKPVSDACHANDMRFVLWFEPERVAAGSDIARQHPEFVLGGKDGGLFNLGAPAARRWMTDLLSSRIEEYGVDVYRNDFNFDPLPFWRAADTADRQGVTEIRYVEGLYAMWDELRARHPGLLIDNCAGGGRRIDLEMCSRSVPLWRSDTGCSPGHPEWNQMQSAVLAQYVPLYGISTWSPDVYETRSAATAGSALEWPYLDDAFPSKLAAETVAEIRDCQPYWYGDVYPLTPATTALDQIAAWQLHRPDLDAGVVLAFRRPECAYQGIIVGLHGLDAAARYRVEQIGDARRRATRTMTGEQLMTDLALRPGSPGSSLLVRYRRVSARARAADAGTKR